MQPLSKIRQIDYTVIFARNMGAMRNFYETQGALSLQLAFRIPPQAVAECAAALEAKGVKLISPLTDHPFGHRTIFFRDPDGNVLEIFEEI
jgi:lactoylglutathione lyase